MTKVSDKNKKYQLTDRQKRYYAFKSGTGRLLAGVALMGLSPVFLTITGLLKLENGKDYQAIFTQTRNGKDKQHFELYKFRTMKMDTPQNVPTHMLENPDQYITSIGKFLRKYSLDELPQIINILKGDMTWISYRPSLWNQEDLIEEREKYGVHQIKPGLTGFAQTHGRDELEIPVKAKMDAIYLKNLGPMMDLTCFFDTVSAVVHADGVVEGKTPAKEENSLTQNRKQTKQGQIKICILTTISETMDWFVTDTARYLSEHGFDVTLVCHMSSTFQKENSEYATCINIPMERSMNIANARESFQQIYWLFKREQYDIIQYSTPNAALYASIAGKLAGIPTRLYCQWGLRYVSAKGKERQLLKALEKLTCNLSTYIEPDSFGNLNLGRREGLYSAKKSAVVWNGSANGVNLEQFNIRKKAAWRQEIRTEYSISDDAYVFGFVGRTDRDKGFNEMLTAFRNLAEDHEDIYLLMAGMEDKTETLNQRLYYWSKSSPKVIYVGLVSDPERYMSAMDCLLLPSYREGFGTVVIEAGALGIPVIASDIPGPQESIINGKTGLLVKSGSTEDLLQKMTRLYEHQEEGIKLGHAAVAHVKNKYDSSMLHKYIAEDRRRLVIDAKREKVISADIVERKDDARKEKWKHPERISVIMGIYNCADTLKEAVSCIQAQTYSNWELIMCDDGSTDNTYQVAKDLAAKSPERILVLKNGRNHGLGYSLNRCLKKARGGYIARMDGDDLCSPDRFEKEIGALRANPDMAIVSTAMEFFDESGVWGIIRHPEYVKKEDFTVDGSFCHAPCMVRREAYEAVGGYTDDPRLLRVEDYHLWIKMYAAGFKGMNLQEAYYQMRDDRNAYNRRKFKYRINEAYVKTLAVKMLGLPNRYLFKAGKPIVVGLLPAPLYDKLHKGRLGK